MVDVADAKYLLPWAYTSEEWFEYEKEAVYPRSWLVSTALETVKAGLIEPLRPLRRA